MKIISHRGLWRSPAEKNSLRAFQATIDSGFGTETDVRDLCGRLVISHDPPDADALACDAVLDLFAGRELPLAVNVKADGLAPLLRAAFAGRAIDWFAFDMSAPEMRRYAGVPLPFFTRHSDIEPEPVLYGAARGVWLDAFASDWFDCDVIVRHIQNGKEICVVSPELHGRDPEALWRRLAALPADAPVSLCTDRPIAAREAFCP